MELPNDDGNFPVISSVSSPIREDRSNITELIPFLSTLSDSMPPLFYANRSKIENILDKSISVDDDNLITPLEPVRLLPKINREFSKVNLPPILWKSDDSMQMSDDSSFFIKKVSFPANVEKLISYKEPEYINPFVILEQVSSQEILAIYENSCLKNNTIEINTIMMQLHEIKNNTDRSADLKLANINITYEVLETLEDIFKVTNFNMISLTDCPITPGAIAVLFDLLEYYECVTHFVLSVDLDQLDAWKLFCNLISKTVQMKSVTFKSMNINDTNMKNFVNSINSNGNIKSINFDNCALTKLPNFTLIECLELNYTLNELRLPQVGLYTREADIIGKLMKKNFSIQILDISNNLIGDRGLEQLAKGLCEQNIPGQGLSVLIIFNNQISEKSGKTINSIISKCINLRTLNIGFNNLTDSVITDIIGSLKQTRSLEGLGLQATVLTCKGVIALAEAITENKSLEKINLKGNKAIHMEGLEALSRALITSKISKVEMDETNRSCVDAEGYSEVVKKIKEICTINKTLVDQSLEEDLFRHASPSSLSRKVSLKCEPYYNTPPPTTTCFSTSSPRSRFSVSKVVDSFSKPTSNARFKVEAVSNISLKNYNLGNISIVEEECDNNQFENQQCKRVSSIDNVESTITSTINNESDNLMPVCESE